MIELFGVLLLVGPALIAAILCGFLAKGRGRSAIKWGLVGLLIAFLASAYRLFTVGLSGDPYGHSIASVFGFDYGMATALAMLIVCHVFTSGEKT